jgi:DNA-binding CsgD family transcriptional regulator
LLGEKLIGGKIMPLRFASPAAQRRKMLEQRRGGGPDLSRRQLEVASWLAQGKSNDDIAEILDLSAS